MSECKSVGKIEAAMVEFFDTPMCKGTVPSDTVADLLLEKAFRIDNLSSSLANSARRLAKDLEHFAKCCDNYSFPSNPLIGFSTANSLSFAHDLKDVRHQWTGIFDIIQITWGLEGVKLFRKISGWTP
jgi:hypothetical protein